MPSPHALPEGVQRVVDVAEGRRMNLKHERLAHVPSAGVHGCTLAPSCAHHDARSTARPRRQMQAQACTRRARRVWPRRSAPWQAERAFLMALCAHRPTVASELKQHVMGGRAFSWRVSARCRHALAQLRQRVQHNVIDLLKSSGSCKKRDASPTTDAAIAQERLGRFGCLFRS